MRDISIVVLTPHDPERREHWSGTPHFLIAELRRRYARVTVISGQRTRLLLRVIRWVLRPWRIDPFREMLMARLIGRMNARKIARLKPDLVFGVAASHMIADVRTTAPVIHFSDATFQAVIGYYDEFSGFSPRTLEQGNRMERAALHRAAAALLASEWAANSATTDYQLPADRIVVAPLGANVDVWPPFDPDRARGDVCRLLFVGVDWCRKGGDLAYEILRGLLARGHKAELHIVGCDPPIAAGAEGVHRHGFLRKSEPEEFERLQQLYQSSSFFVLPTRAEAFGLVFAEASAFGLPVLATRTGGVASVVESGVNGALFEPDAGAEDYVEWIEMLWSDADAYRRMRRSSRAKFERELNWTAWGDKASALIERLVGEDQAAGGRS